MACFGLAEGEPREMGWPGNLLLPRPLGEGGGTSHLEVVASDGDKDLPEGVTADDVGLPLEGYAAAELQLLLREFVHLLRG